MKDEFENIDDLFASELKGYAPSPPAGMWEQIEQKIPQKKGRKSLILFYRIAASIVLLLSAGSLGIYLLNHTPDQEITTAEVFINETPEVAASTPNKTIEKEYISYEKSSAPNNLKTKQTTPVSVKPATPVQKNENIEESVTLVSEKEKEYIPTEKSINAIEAELSQETTKNKTIIYESKKPEDSEAYKAFLEEFDALDDDETYRQKWAIGGQAGPQYSYRQVSASSNNVSQEFVDKYDQEESGLIAYAGGVNIAYKPARRLSIQSGVYYSKMGQTMPAQPAMTFDNQNVTAIDPGGWSAPLDGTTELRISSSLGDIESPAVDKTLEAPNNQSDQFENVSHVNQYLEFLEIPLMARYAIIDRKVNFHLLGGLSTNFLIASPIYLDNGDYYKDNDDLTKVNYSSTFGLGLGYNFSSNFIFSIEPQFKYYLNKVNNDPETDVHPYSFGVFTGITYLF